MYLKDFFTRGLAFLLLLWSVEETVYSQIDPSCSLITDNYSGQITNSRCAPVTLSMEVVYKFMAPVDPSKVQILYRWNDGTGAETIVTPTSLGDTVFTTIQSHTYPPAGNCSYTAEAYIIANGVICSSSSRQEQSFSSWARDNENGGVLSTQPPEALFCEGEDVYVQFRDNSTFNCNILMEPDKPNRLTRWVQFIYGTNTTSGHRIPNLTIVDNNGVVHQMTDNMGNPLGTFAGPIIEVPINADFPNQTAYPIYAPAGAVAGDIFEITLRNWNVCNAYDNKPFDGVSPVDIVNGDNPPITRPVLVRIITTPPVVTNAKEDYCVNSAIELTVPQAGDVIRWYSDSLRTTLIHTGATLNPLLPPVSIDNSVAGNYHFYVTDAIGQCESAPSRIDLEIFSMPQPRPNAGPDHTICSDRFRLEGNQPVIGTGLWTTASPAIIVTPVDPRSWTTNLQLGRNRFTWTMTNGPCRSSDNVNITSDRQPASAFAGRDTALCNTRSLRLNALPVNNSGTGTWTVIAGGATIADSNNPHALVSGLTQGKNRFVWTVRSRYGACPETSDTASVLLDLASVAASVGPDLSLCDVFGMNLPGNLPTNGATGLWTKLAGNGTSVNVQQYNSAVNNLSEGLNTYVWTIRSRFGVCPVTDDTLNIGIDLSPLPANAGADQYFCNVTVSNPINANPPSRGTAQWLVSHTPNGVLPAITPSNNSTNIVLSVNPGNEGRYDLVWRIQNGACVSTDTVIIDFGLLPSPASAGLDEDTCGLEAILNATPPASGWGTWRQISGPGTISFPAGTNDPKAQISIPAGQEGTYKLEWKITSGTCPVDNSNIDTVTVVFRPKPLLPIFSDVQHCGPTSFTINTTLNTNAVVNRWYDASVMGNMLHEGQVYTTPVLNNSKTYYLTGYNGVSQCESERIPLNAVIDNVPGIPIASGSVHCGDTSVLLQSFLPINATHNRWYADSTTATILKDSLDYQTSWLNQSTAFYVSGYDSISGCESKRREVVVEINKIPQLPVGSDLAICGGGRLLMNASSGLYGNTIRWYDSIVGPFLLEEGNQYLTPNIDTTRSYWISSYNDSTGCESGRKEIKAIVLPVPGLPAYVNQSSCGAETISFVGVVGTLGTTNVWYDNFDGEHVVHTGKDYYPYLTSSRTYWVSSYNQLTGCESPMVRVDAEILAIPTTGQIQGPAIVALNQSNVVYSVQPRIGSSYYWTLPADVTSVLQLNNILLAEFPSLGNKTISVYEIAANGCRGPERFKDILVKQEIINVSINAPDTGWCVNSPVQLLAQINGGTPMYDINWSGDVTSLSAIDIADPVFHSNHPGVFRLKVAVKDINGNMASDSVTVTVHHPPVTNIPVADTTICGGVSLLITPQNTGGSGFYTYHEWTGSTINLTPTNMPYTTFRAFGKGVYKAHYKITDSNGCMATDSVNINVLAPEARFVSKAQPSCSPVVFGFQNQSIDGVTYLWTFGDGDSSTTVNASHIFLNQGTSVVYYEVSLKAKDVNGCSHTVNDYVQVYPNPDVPITVAPDTVCSPSDVLLSATPGGFSYQWDFGDGTGRTGSYNAFHTYTNNTAKDTVFHIKLVSTSFFGCMDTSWSHLMVRPSPKANFSVTPETQMYPETSVSLNNLTNPGSWLYQWDFGDGITATSANPGTHSFHQAGNYTIRLLVQNSFCADSTERRVKILPHPPIAEFNPIDPGCMPLTVHFQNYSAYSDTYLWDFGDGSVSNKPNPTYTYYEAGVYNVKLTVTGPGGSDTKSRQSTVYVLPKAFFDIAPKFTYVNDQPVNFFDMSDNATEYLWDFGDGTTSKDPSPVHTYTQQGIYNIVLKVRTENNCLDVYTKESAVVVEASGKVEYPNVFSPFANLSENKIFLPAVLDNVLEYHLMIYNRWGEMVFESRNNDIGWDGTYKGKPAKQDVYMWKVIGKYDNGRSFVKTGDVTLLY
ncbi:MAG TPA: PKD domain-containing protein [Bacteroidales bacterium]|nr:PKD domain-containing protein [Bacteroidales bacterium]